SHPVLEVPVQLTALGDLDLEARLLETLGPFGNREGSNVRRIAPHLDLLKEVPGRGRGRAVDEGGGASRLQHAQRLAQESGEIVEVMWSRPHRIDVEGPVGEGQPARV